MPFPSPFASATAEELRAVGEALPDGVLVVDAAGVVRFANAAAARLLGRDAPDLVGAPLGFPVADRLTMPAPLPTSVDAAGATDGARDAAPVVPPGSVSTALARVLEMRVAPLAWRGDAARVVSLRDVTEFVARYDHARAAALRDPLTGLANRTWMDEHLAQAIRLARREGSLVAVLFVDLDDFKEVNDRWGHAAGDALLRSVADRLRASVRAGDGLARLAGDEFALALAGLADRAQAEGVARKVLAAVEPEHDLGAQRVRVGASVGVALYPTDAATPVELLMLADTAMYRAKSAGKGRLAFI